MKLSAAHVFLSALLVLSLGSPALAIPAFKKAFEQYYAKNAGVMAGLKEQNCFVCHYGKNDKTKRNDYGRALSDILDRDNYKDERFKLEPAKAKQELEDAFKQVESQKVKDGSTTFGERIKAGKLPGTPEM